MRVLERRVARSGISRYSSVSDGRQGPARRGGGVDCCQERVVPVSNPSPCRRIKICVIWQGVEERERETIDSHVLLQNDMLYINFHTLEPLFFRGPDAQKKRKQSST